MEKVRIERYDNQGQGIGYINNKIIFIPNALIGELIETEIIEDKKNYFVGKNINIIEKSLDRIDPVCPYFYECGGCSLQNMSYQNNKEYKINKIKNLFERNNINYNKINFIENKNEYNYRNKIELKMENGKIGFYQNNTHDLVEINECMITKSCINKVIPYLLKSGLNNAKITIRANYNDELLLIIDTEDNFNYEEIITNNKIAGIIVNGITIHNDPFFMEIINNMMFRVSYNAFFQVNNYICSELFNIIENNIKKDSIVADLYCGVGTLSIVEANKAKKVYGIEIVENAIKDALFNAKINHKDNIYFNLGSVPNILPKIKDKLDIIVVDPPRAGLDKKTLNTILEYKPNKILYTSCDPLTLVRDLNELKKEYEIKELNLLDMFSYTYHVECVCVMKLR